MNYFKLQSKTFTENWVDKQSCLFDIETCSLLENVCFWNIIFLFFKIHSWNFQHLFDLGFHETSRNFSSFKWGICGYFFLSLSFSRSQVVNFLKWKHHYLSENIAIFHSNDDLFTQYLFLNKKKGVIWWLFHDDLRAREQEREEKETTNSALLWCV